MEIISAKLYGIIQDDVEKINSQLLLKEGSGALRDELRVKYEIIFPELSKILNQCGGKISTGGEFDYRPELKRIKSALLTKLLINDLDPKIDENVSNDSNILLNQSISIHLDSTLNELIEESKLYIRDNSDKRKQLAIEKIWDAFERFKSISHTDKKKSIELILKTVSNGSEEVFNSLEKECFELTNIGNTFQIRHFEINQVSIKGTNLKEYWYFRMLTFLSFCIRQLKSMNES